MKLQLMITCLSDVIRPGVGRATVRILRRLGHPVEFRQTQTCCGQPMFNSGFLDMAREQAKYTIGVFAGRGPVIVPSGSCAAMVKVEYPHLLEGDPLWHSRACDLAQRTFELSDFLVNHLGVVDLGARYRAKVTYHDACHLRMLQQQGEVEQLIRHVQGVTYVPVHRVHQCCGFGGSFAVRYPGISGAMVSDKVDCIAATGADVVVSTDNGCLMNIGGRLHRQGRPIEALHFAELLARGLDLDGR